MKDSAIKEQELVIPAGGIADFYMEDHEIADLEKQEAKDAYGEKGIANFQEVASRMASYGRYGDDKVAHVETGELIVPKALIDNNPDLKESIFKHLEEMGIEDPERYVVGSNENSINPDTGMPEFFFKALSKIAKGVTKAIGGAVKSVVKVVKRVAPVILPIALSFTPLGPIYGAALGSGIGTLLRGGSPKDALKSALLAGGTGALFTGFTGGGSFGENVSNALSNPVGRLGQTLSGAKSTLTGQGFTGQGNLFTPYTAPGSQVIPTQDLAALNTPAQAQGMPLEARLTPQGQVMNTQVVSEPSMLDKAKDFLFRGGQSKGDITAAANAAEVKATQDYINKFGYQTLSEAPATVQTAALEAGKKAAEAVQPGFIQKFGPTGLLAATALGAGGFFSEPEPEEDVLMADIGPTGAELLAQQPGTYGVQGTQVTGSMGPYLVPTRFPFSPNPNLYNLDRFTTVQPVNAAEGGEIFPRRTGGIMPDEGIPNKDSVRAMLMPGEFVMTTDAVKGLGNGNMRQGINNMYDMMRGLEAKGRAMA